MNKVQRIDVNEEAKTLNFADLGVTARRLLGAASADYRRHKIRKWKLLYNGVPIGSIQLRSLPEEGE